MYVVNENNVPVSTLVVCGEGWNKWVRELDSSDKPVDAICSTQTTTAAGSAAGPSRTIDLTKHCKYHDVKWHDTTECKSLYAHYLSSLASGDFKFEPLKAKPENGKSWSKNIERRAQRKATGKGQHSETQQRDDEEDAPKTNGEADSSADEEQPANRIRIEVATSQRWPTRLPNHPSITFLPDDAEGIHVPHSDPLLVVLGIGEYDVTKVLIDTRSSVDLIFRGTLQKMGVDLDDIKPSSRTLTGFNGSSETIVGTIRLPEGEVLELPIDDTDPSRTARISAYLSEDMQQSVLNFLKANVSTFALSMSDMKGIDPAITTHELNVDPTVKPIRQKRRKLGPDRPKAVNEEVDRLLGAGSIFVVRYPECYPLPNIDRLVESTVGNEMLTFMDTFSGYNQIMMHPDDREKTAFITYRGTYCYKVMPFGLKNAGATYQRLVNKMSADKLGVTMEVYIDDMLVKSLHAADHLSHLQDCFETLNKYGMKLNPAKCTFGVSSGEEVQRLTGRIAALNRFISRSTDKCLPFYDLLRGSKRFIWDEKCKEAFIQLKHYLTTPPVLAKPDIGDVLSLYVAVSQVAVSSVLIKEDRGEQKPIFYTSRRMTGPETRYPTLEKMALAVVEAARKLRPYFQSHSVEVLTDQPLRTILQNTNRSGRLTKWAIELGELDITYKNRTATKSQVLADFLIELAPELEQDLTLPNPNWTLHVDGSSTNKGAGAGVQLQSPTGELIRHSFSFGFPASNNEAEYESLIAGLRLAKAIKTKRLSAYCDSQLFARQFSGDYDARNDRMDAYLKIVQGLAA
ncbi:PREDICTED: uncharacterized protein LOC106338416 [Brassica oleracea var. oleracea]|uniref:uncharacterized protein LOC106338416 n=1 Tax=Brassica oleracea var. oleracea TaxID=109376 RepID=UPI0006A72287|nr:PREDICTED: uncharacterized protein LOC106338416 [Brassica oleracea var. oleracea]